MALRCMGARWSWKLKIRNFNIFTDNKTEIFLSHSSYTISTCWLHKYKLNFMKLVWGREFMSVCWQIFIHRSLPLRIRKVIHLIMWFHQKHARCQKLRSFTIMWENTITIHEKIHIKKGYIMFHREDGVS